MSELEPALVSPQAVVETERHVYFDRVKQIIGRVGLAVALTAGGVIGSEVGHATENPAAAATDDYPDANKPCVNKDDPQYGQITGEGYWCTGYDWGDLATGNENSSRGYGYRNCTDWVAFRSPYVSGKSVPTNWGNADTWDDKARAQGYHVEDGSNMTVEVGDILVKDTMHVAIVESVSSPDSVNISEYNYNRDGNYWTRTVNPKTTFDHLIDLNGTGTGGGGGGSTAKAGEGGGNTASWSVGRMDAFYQNTNATGPNLYQKYFETNVGWKEGLLADTSGYRLSASPAAVSWGPNRLDIFGRSAGGELIHKWYDGGWHNWEKLGGCILGSPSVTSWAPGRLDIFAKGCNSTGPNLMHRWFDGSWKGWETVPFANGRIASSPTAVSQEQNRIDIFGIDENNNNVLHDWFESGWYPQESLGGCLTDQLAVSSWQPGRLDIFAEGCNASGQNTYHKVFDAGWHDWELLPGADNMTVDKMLGAISWANQRVDLFARGNNGALIHKWWDGNAWSSWESLGGTIAP